MTASALPATGQTAAYTPSVTEVSPAVTRVDPLIIRAPQMVPQVGGDASDLRGCIGSDVLWDMRHGFAVTDEADLLVRAELAYDRAYRDVQNPPKGEEAASRARLLEAERSLADVQDVRRRLPQGAPYRQIVEAHAAERTHNAGVQGIYVPDEYRDLGISDIAAAQRQEAGATVLHITGVIHNTRQRAISVPPLWFAAVGRNGDTLKAQQMVPEHRARIPAGGTVPFTFDLKQVPGDPARAAVTFAPENRGPQVLPPQLGCGGQSFAIGRVSTR